MPYKKANGQTLAARIARKSGHFDLQVDIIVDRIAANRNDDE